MDTGIFANCRFHHSAHWSMRRCHYVHYAGRMTRKTAFRKNFTKSANFVGLGFLPSLDSDVKKGVFFLATLPSSILKYGMCSQILGTEFHLMSKNLICYLELRSRFMVFHTEKWTQMLQMLNFIWLLESRGRI